MTKRDRIAEALTAHWGKRCSEYAAGCPCCEAWKQYDALSKPPAALEKLVKKGVDGLQDMLDGYADKNAYEGFPAMLRDGLAAIEALRAALDPDAVAAMVGAAKRVAAYEGTAQELAECGCDRCNAHLDLRAAIEAWEASRDR